MEQDWNCYLLLQGCFILEYVYEQICELGSMVILVDVNGLLLEIIGDFDFVDCVDCIVLLVGVLWDENQCGINVIGIVLVEEVLIVVFGVEYFLECNGFLVCCVSLIFGLDGWLIGVFDIFGDYCSQQYYMLGLV